MFPVWVINRAWAAWEAWAARLCFEMNSYISTLCIGNSIKVKGFDGSFQLLSVNHSPAAAKSISVIIIIRSAFDATLI